MRYTAIILIVALTSSCASMRKHPVITGAVVGLGAGAVLAVRQNKHNSCPTSIDGVPYSGTPPCPTYWPPTKH